MFEGDEPSRNQRCPDGGHCHHDCDQVCNRTQVGGPLSGVFPGNRWPPGLDIRPRRPLPEPPAAIAHDGETYDPKADAAPLNKQQQAVFALMRDGMFRTLADIAAGTGHPEASVSARLRDLRKPKWGGHEVVRRRRGGSRTWEYALIERKWED